MFKRSRRCCAQTLMAIPVSSGRANGMGRFCGRSGRPSPRTWTRAPGGVRLKDWSSFLFSGWADEALRLGWPHDELFRVPSLWSRVDLCGAALLIGDREVVNITSTEIRIKTASGSTLAFYRKPQVDYGVAYRARIKMAGEDARKEGREEEVKLHALEAVARLYLSHHSGADIDTAKAAVLAAIKEAAP